MSKFYIGYVAKKGKKGDVYTIKINYLTDGQNFYVFDHISNFTINTEFIIKNGKTIQISVYFYTIHFYNSNHYIILEVPEDNPKDFVFRVHSYK